MQKLGKLHCDAAGWGWYDSDEELKMLDFGSLDSNPTRCIWFDSDKELYMLTLGSYYDYCCYGFCR